MSTFKIGDKVFQARARQETIWITCPECLGSGRLRVILGDKSQVSIPCVCCERGYEGSPGKIQSCVFFPSVGDVTITGIELRNRDGVEKFIYHANGWHVDEAELFLTEAGAVNYSEHLVAKHEAEEKKRLGHKQNQHKTWAWNVAYWRREIRDAKKRIESAEAHLATAPKNIKNLDQEQS